MDKNLKRKFDEHLEEGMYPTPGIVFEPRREPKWKKGA